MFAEQLNEEVHYLIGLGLVGQDDGTPDPWAEAACRDSGDGSMAELFFSEDIPDIAAAKEICASCPLSAECLAGALERREPAGVWGGQLFVNGRVLPRKRRRGRPPKNPQPGVMLSA